MIIEFGHVYYENIINKKLNIDDIKKEIKIIENLKLKKYTSVVLIDDKNYNLDLYEKKKVENQIKLLYSNLGHCPDYVYFEKEFYFLEKIINTIIERYEIKREYFKKENKYVYFLYTKNYKIPIYFIKENNKYYTCQSLALLWSIYKHKKATEYYLNDFKVINILNLKYKKVEDQINEILLENDFIFKNEYYYYD
jgi:hypothetical protein